MTKARMEVIVMSKETNRALIQELTNEVWNAGNLSRLEALYAPDSVQRTLPKLTATVAGLRGALPNLHLTVDESIADGDKVVTRWTIHGTNLGRLEDLSGIDVLGGKHRGEDFIEPLVDISPTDRNVAIGGVSVFYVQNGKVASSWGLIDRPGLLRQLPVFPSPGLATI
jgi:predicted ester cyclase